MKIYMLYSRSARDDIDEIELVTTDPRSAFDPARLDDADFRSYYIDVWENDKWIELYKWSDKAWQLKRDIAEPKETK